MRGKHPVFVALVAAFVLLAGCGQNASQPPAAPAPASQEQADVGSEAAQDTDKESAGDDSGGNVTDQAAYVWQLAIHEARLAPSLHTDGTLTQYDGTVEKVSYDNAPAQGNTYLLLHLGLTKAKPGGEPFHWGDLAVRDSGGAEYARSPEDSFLENHEFARLQATDLMLGENDGWVCFEIPTNAANSGLSLVHKAAEGENVLPIQTST